MPTAIEIPFGDRRVPGLVYPAPSARVTLLLGHGAGADQHHEFLVRHASALAERGVEVVTFNFLYTAEKRRAPDRPLVLEACYRAAIEAVRPRARRLAIGGKSMGGRIASQVAAEGAGELVGLVFFGYPLHAPNKPDQPRSAHLPRVRAPMLFVQGEKDSFGTPDELAPLLPKLARGSELFVVAGGDHSLKVPKRAGPQAEIDLAVQQKVIAWLASR
jgi:predicted alpha/beta-hydrolase family hydrolase